MFKVCASRDTATSFNVCSIVPGVASDGTSSIVPGVASEVAQCAWCDYMPRGDARRVAMPNIEFQIRSINITSVVDAVVVQVQCFFSTLLIIIFQK
jgi:hypothetical protein